MSATDPAPVVLHGASPVSDTGGMTLWAAPAVSILSIGIFLAALLIAYISKSDTALTLLLGVAATNFTTVVSFWVGSSAGSQKKDATISNLSGPAAPAAPPTP